MGERRRRFGREAVEPVFSYISTTVYPVPLPSELHLRTPSFPDYLHRKFPRPSMSSPPPFFYITAFIALDFALIAPTLCRIFVIGVVSKMIRDCEIKNKRYFVSFESLPEEVEFEGS
ncbi:hypothetical protein L1887_01028 [Cichorium endivia]|nr:hypothetical protein L1887_01028 [Cichorium endivia]